MRLGHFHSHRVSIALAHLGGPVQSVTRFRGGSVTLSEQRLNRSEMLLLRIGETIRPGKLRGRCRERIVAFLVLEDRKQYIRTVGHHLDEWLVGPFLLRWEVVAPREVDVVSHGQVDVVQEDEDRQVNLEPIFFLSRESFLFYGGADEVEDLFQQFVDCDVVYHEIHDRSNRHKAMIRASNIVIWAHTQFFVADDVPRLLDESAGYPKL